MSEDGRARKETVAQIFDRAASVYDQSGIFAYFGERLATLAQVAHGARVLDVATGRGAVLFPAAIRIGTQGHVCGIDLSAMMVQETGFEIKRRRLQNAKVVKMDAEALDFPDAGFDAVLCGFALSFFPRLERGLAEFRRVLKPGGKIAVTTWGERDQRWTWYHDLLKTYLPSQTAEPRSTPFIFDKPNALRATLTNAGFVDVQVQVEEKEFVYANPAAWWSSLWSCACRQPLEKMPPDALKKFQADVFEKIQMNQQADGIYQCFQAVFTFATKPLNQ